MYNIYYNIIGTLLFTSCNIIIIHSSRIAVGKTNAIAAVFGGVMKALAPTAFTNIFAWFSTSELFFPFDYHFAFFLSAAFAFVIFVLSFILPVSIGRHGLTEKPT